MLIGKSLDILSSEITSERSYFSRRRFVRDAAVVAGALIARPAYSAIVPAEREAMLSGTRSKYSTTEEPNSFEDISTYNNYYEFGTSKGDPARNSATFEPRPWSITVSGHAENTGAFDLEDFVKPHQLEERVYRMRCVEAWSMVIPWVGIPLADVIHRFRPTSNAKFVAFETLRDPDRMPGQKARVLSWPYREGLTIAEATHPLTILAVGLYGRALPNANGAPIRLVVPWKYGFKGIKGIVSMRFVETRPATSWEMAAPNEYGFYANVNPDVDHPRWSQARERRIGGAILEQKQPTLMFNGYGEHVAHLYAGLDLRKNF
jgi:sulfoxide reductase catalytic subunit YedY